MPGRYTPPSVTFRTVGPLPSGACQARFDSVSPNDISHANGRTVLVVDDEADVLRLLQSILTEEGYDVVAARSANAAIQAFEMGARHADLLLVDVVMPGMSGPMLVDRLRGIDPNLKVLFMSGYDDRDIVRHYVVEKGFHLISKPFTMFSLRQAMNALLDGSEPAPRKEPVA